VVGVGVEGGAASGERVAEEAAVVDVSGKPVAGAPVDVEVFERQFYSYRKRLVGGFYAYEHAEQVKRLGPLCRGATDARGRFECEGKPPASGRLGLHASTEGAAGARAPPPPARVGAR